VLNINKAGIDASIPCETSIIASGNPENSRFGDYDQEHEQFDIVDSLLDRFDLVFTLRDTPEESKDRSIAMKDIAQRAESGLVARNDMADADREAATPAVEMPLLQAWVADARQNTQPVIESDAVRKRIVEFYVEVRSQSDGDVVPATVRDLDAVQRLAEACARVRKSDTVSEADAELAIAMTMVSLRDTGYDPETGKLDADYRGGRTTQTQQDEIKRVKGLVSECQGEDPAKRKEVVKLAESTGIQPDKAQHHIDSLLDKGLLYQPGGQGTLRVS